MKLNCIRTKLALENDGMESSWIDVNEASVIIGFDNRLWVKLSPGVTGYESASVEDLLKESYRGDWSACAGTPGSWDRLVVPFQEMERLKDILRLIPQPKEQKTSEAQ